MIKWNFSGVDSPFLLKVNKINEPTKKILRVSILCFDWFEAHWIFVFSDSYILFTYNKDGESTRLNYYFVPGNLILAENVRLII